VGGLRRVPKKEFVKLRSIGGISNTEFRGRQFWFKFGSDQQVVYELNALAIDGLLS
jgi:hypothetical protein